MDAPLAGPTATSPETKAQAVQELKSREDVQVALEEVQPKPPPRGRPTRQRSRAWWLAGAAVVLAAAIVAHRIWPLGGSLDGWIGNALRAGIAIVLILALEQALESVTRRRLEDEAARFNARRVMRLLAVVLVVAVLITALFQSWYTTLASLGLASLILGFALQPTITSFIAWIYILARRPYRVGDRIRIEQATGDVIDLGYLDTTLWEVGGEHLSSDHPSGRIVKFPNSRVLHTAVFNYSWPLFPYIWNEIRIDVGWRSDLELVARILRDSADEVLGAKMAKRIETYREILAETPVDDVNVRENPSVLFRPGGAGRVEAIVRYLVEPKEAGRAKTVILQRILAHLSMATDRVHVPG